MNIGENLRRLRTGKGLTQERLAEVMGVSAQAVSRWENDQAYPDISLLPGLAMYFGVSIDEIVGMEGVRKKERLHAAMNEIYTLARQGDLDGAIARIRENLKIYPDNGGLLLALSETLARKMDDAEALREAISAAERALSGNGISMKARSTAAVNLLFLYRRAGMAEKAEELVRGLPHIWESREMVQPEIYEGQEYVEALKGGIRKALAFLCMKIDGCEARKTGETPEYIQLGVKFENGMSDEEMMRRIERFLAGEDGTKAPV